MNRSAARVRDGGRPAIVVYFVCAVYVYVVGALLAWASLPVLTGLTPTLIISGSMEPSIHAGDLVLVRSDDGAGVEPGAVITFADPGHKDRLLTHRVVSINPDGSLRTRGDANDHADSSAVSRAAVRGVGRFLVPAVGVPLMWIRAQAWLQLGLWLGGSLFAASYLRLYARRIPLVASWSTSLRPQPQAERTPAPTAQSGRPAWETPVSVRRRFRPGVATAVVAALAVVAVVLPRAASSEAAFTATTNRAGNSLAAAGTFCSGSVTLNPTADATVTDGSTTNVGTATTLRVTNKNSVERSLLQFAIPPSGCTTTASLRLWTTAGNTGRTLNAYATSATFTETSVTYGSGQPGTTGSPTTTASVASGWVTFNVSPQVAAIAAGTAFGFSVRDSDENGGGPSKAQIFASRQSATNKPELVLTYVSTPPPAAPTSLTATTLSASRISLAWTDNSAGTAGFRIQRSPAGAATWTTVTNVSVGTTSYIDTGLTASTAYDYRVRATSSGGSSAYSNTATATTSAPASAPPTAPNTLAAAAAGVNQMTLTWTDAASDEDGFTVQRAPAGTGSWADVASVGANATGRTDTGLTANTAYDYRVRAFNSAGTSAWSNTATATTSTCASLAAQTLIAEADNTVFSGTTYSNTNFGSDPSVFYIYSLAGTNGRSLLRFATPTLVGGCSVATATLRVYNTTATAGRTLQAFKVAAPWVETTVTWNTQPATTGTAVTTTAATGWQQWNVTPLIGAAGTGLPDGVLLRDATEDAGTAQSQLLVPREGATANRPQLVVTFGP